MNPVSGLDRHVKGSGPPDSRVELTVIAGEKVTYNASPVRFLKMTKEKLNKINHIRRPLKAD